MINSLNIYVWSIGFVMLICVCVLYWIYLAYRKELHITDIIKEYLSIDDNDLYDEYLNSYSHTDDMVLCFLKDRLTEKEFKEFLFRTDINTPITTISRHDGVFDVDNKLVRLPPELFMPKKK